MSLFLPILPILHMDFPREVTALHQIEITSRCDLRCTYCPSPNLGRPKVDMTREIYERCLAIVRLKMQAGTQRELNLAGIGESTIHPDFLEYLKLAREAVGPDLPIVFATNGLETAKRGQGFVEKMVPYHPQVWVSLHRPEKAGIAVEMYRRAGLFAGNSTDPSTNGNDWAGQVKWHNALGNDIPCMWMREGKMFAMADGWLSACCLDATGRGVIGHVNDKFEEGYRTQPWSACRSCYQHVGVRGYDQYGTGQP